MRDVYDAEVERLMANPGDIPRSWRHFEPLFEFCIPRGVPSSHNGKCYGCLTMVRGGSGVAWTDELTAAIVADERLPRCDEDIRPEHLTVFAEWQRKLDVLLNRPAPEAVEVQK